MRIAPLETTMLFGETAVVIEVCDEAGDDALALDADMESRAGLNAKRNAITAIVPKDNILKLSLEFILVAVRGLCRFLNIFLVFKLFH